jgi:hypothetical protein
MLPYVALHPFQGSHPEGMGVESLARRLFAVAEDTRGSSSMTRMVTLVVAPVRLDPCGTASLLIGPRLISSKLMNTFRKN